MSAAMGETGDFKLSIFRGVVSIATGYDPAGSLSSVTMSQVQKYGGKSNILQVTNPPCGPRRSTHYAQLKGALSPFPPSIFRSNLGNNRNLELAHHN